MEGGLSLFDIRYVALYLRKSRGEEDKDLEKHRFVLIEMCKKNNWKFIEYVEIANSETIEFRPKFKQLLKDVEEGIFDAVLVVDYQRLGRGETEEQGKIKRIFRDSGTYIVTPEKIYNLVDETDDLLVDVRGLLANQEYKSTKKNLLRGKKIGARLGNWANGPAPFPYLYDASIKGLKVDETRREHYLLIKKLFLEDDKTTEEISWFLNKKNIPGPTGGIWHENTVRRVLLSETHLGRIISNKTQGSGHKKKKTKPLVFIPREEWVIIENCHEALKTIEEHEKILEKLNRRRIVPHAARRGAYILSGLVYCGKCGSSMQFVKKPSGVSVKTCQHSDAIGNRCGNRGITTKIILDDLFSELDEFENMLLARKDYSNDEQKARLIAVLEEKETHFTKLKNALKTIKEMREMGDYTLEEYEERRNKRQREILIVEQDIEQLKASLKISEQNHDEERQVNIKKLRDLWTANTNDQEKNAILKSIVDRIEYTRDKEDNIEIRVTFL